MLLAARHRTGARRGASAPAHAQDAAASFPNRPVRIVVPFPAGGPTDVNMRIIGAEAVARTWGQGVVIENRPGANTGIGAQMVAKAPRRRLHAARRDGHDAGDEPGDRRQHELRPVQGFRRRSR